MEKREFYGDSLRTAVDKAASELGVDADSLEYIVLDEGNAGFLGIGARDARIQVEGAFSEPDANEVDVEPVEEELAVEEESPPSEEADAVSRAAIPEVFADEDAEERVEIPPEVVNEASALVASLLEAMGFESRIDAYDAGGFVAVDVASDNTALFIGQKGETIDALQYLVNASINKGRSTRTRIILDAEGYRQRRVEAIQGMAHRTARRAMRESRMVEMPPMNPAERRVVHLFLKDNPDVTTNSEGTGDERRVRISPV